jgi:hypothetical protein
MDFFGYLFGRAHEQRDYDIDAAHAFCLGKYFTMGCVLASHGFTCHRLLIYTLFCNF